MSKDNHPVIKIGVPLNIEVVPNVPMSFLSKVKDMPSPLKLNIKYMDRMSQKKRDLKVAMSFGTCKDEDEDAHGHGHGHGDGGHGHGHGGKKTGKGPKHVMIESKGGG